MGARCCAQAVKGKDVLGSFLIPDMKSAGIGEDEFSVEDVTIQKVYTLPEQNRCPEILECCAKKDQSEEIKVTIQASEKLNDSVGQSGNAREETQLQPFAKNNMMNKYKVASFNVIEPDFRPKDSSNAESRESEKNPANKSDKKMQLPVSKIPIDLSRFRTECKNSIGEKYEIKKMIGEGSSGIVNKIVDKKTHAIRALKIVYKRKFKITANYPEEIEILKRLVK